jgi:AraC-like DNA-binding protein
MSKHFRVSGNIFIKLDELGVSASKVLRTAGLPQTLLQQPLVLLNTEEFFALWRAIDKVSFDPEIGLLLGLERKLEHFQPIGLVALASENFGVAIDRVARYKQLTCPEQIVQERDGDRWTIQFRWLLATAPEPPALIDCCFAWLLSIARKGTGSGVVPLHAEMVGPRWHLRKLEGYFGCRVECRAPRNALIFSVAETQRPFLTRNDKLLGMLAPQLEAELQQQGREENFAERVRWVIRQNLTGRRPTVPSVARGLNVSARTLQRRLQDEGFSFQGLLEDTRRHLARHYLNNSALELNEAAYLLGYEDGNSFVRAFRAWEGVPPARWREQQKQLAVSN